MIEIQYINFKKAAKREAVVVEAHKNWFYMAPLIPPVMFAKVCLQFIEHQLALTTIGL